MLIWGEDCTFYKYSDEKFVSRVLSLTCNNFEAIEYLEFHNVKQILYRWIDPITIKNKLILREQKEIIFWIFEEKKLICCFGNSESGITYAIHNMFLKTNVHLEKIPLFEYWKNIFFTKESWFATLSNIQVKTESTVFNDTNLKNLVVSRLKSSEIVSFFDSDSVASITFRYNNVPFFLDQNSVISFHTTIDESEILEIIKTLAKDIYENYK